MKGTWPYAVSLSGLLVQGFGQSLCAQSLAVLVGRSWNCISISLPTVASPRTPWSLTVQFRLCRGFEGFRVQTSGLSPLWLSISPLHVQLLWQPQMPFSGFSSHKWRGFCFSCVLHPQDWGCFQGKSCLWTWVSPSHVASLQGLNLPPAFGHSSVPSACHFLFFQGLSLLLAGGLVYMSHSAITGTRMASCSFFQLFIIKMFKHSEK